MIGLNGIVGFSRYPLQLISLLGFAFSGFAFLFAIAYLALKLAGVDFPVGNPTIVIVVALLQRHPAALARRDRRVRRPDLRRGPRTGRSTSSSRATASTESREDRERVESRRGCDADALPPVCILAGGLGTRLGERVRDTPKPLLEVAGEPFLLHQLGCSPRTAPREVVLCVGYLGELIEERIGAERFGIEIAYSYDSPGLDGTLGAIRRALPLLGERFLVLYGDTYLRLDYALPSRLARERPAGADDGAAQRRALGHLERCSTRTVVCSPTTSARRSREHALDRLRPGRARARGARARPRTERDLAALYHRLAERASCTASRRPSASTRSARPRRSRRPTRS